MQELKTIDINLLIPFYLMSSYMYYHNNYSPMTDTKYDEMCKMIYDNYDELTHCHKVYVDKDALLAGTGFHINWNTMPKRIISAANNWNTYGFPMPELHQFKKKESENMKQVFILSSNDMDSIVASKVLCKYYPEAVHVAANRRNIDFPEGSLLILVRSYMGASKILSLLDRYEVYIYDLTICDEYKHKKQLEEQGCITNWTSPDMTISEDVWKKLYPSITQPLIIDYTRDYMRWEFKFEESLPIHYAFDLIEPKLGNNNSELFFNLLNNDKNQLDILLEKGTAIQKYLDMIYIILYDELSFEINLEGISTICANIHGVNSLFFTHTLSIDHFDSAMTFSYLPSNNRIHNTIYAIDPEVDVSAIATKFGGGGHKGAAGFTIKGVPFTKATSVSSIDTDYEKLLTASTMSGTVIEYVRKRIHGYSRNAFYGTWRGKSAVFYNTPHLVATDFFENINTSDCEVKVSFCMISTCMYRIACQSVNGEPLPEEYGKAVGSYRIEILPELTHATFRSNEIAKDVFQEHGVI